ncbi:MAG: anti-sigma regulatory factor [bacterium]
MTSCRILADGDVVVARQMARKRAGELGFSRVDQALIATAISELARNIVHYAKSGHIEITEVNRGRRFGLQVVASDQGPGIADIDLAMTDGYSTGNSLGLGLPGTRRLVDEFDIESIPGRGLTVTFIKWKP